MNYDDNSNAADVVMILKDFINRWYSKGLRDCKIELLPDEVVKSLSLLKPILLDWEAKGYIKKSESWDSLFVILKEIPDS